jgi:hypothetical protein
MAKIANNHVSKPSAWVVNSTDRGRKSIKNGKVYLKDSEEFQIELYNPLTDCVLADIKLNGNSISKTGLVLKPGQRFYLDCFIDDKKKFIFSTYEVDASLESINATQNNGKLEVFFYKESVVSIKNWRDRFNTVIIERYYPTYPTYPNTWITYGSGTLSGNTTGGYYTNNIIGTNTSGSTTTTSYNSTNATYTTGVDLSNCIGSLSSGHKINTSFETGRVEKGSSSSQKFSEIDMDFDTYHISSTILQLLPESVKPVSTSDIKKEPLKNKVNETELKKEWDKIKEIDGILDLIKKLDDLHKAGVLTDEEFSEKKKELLSNIC